MLLDSIIGTPLEVVVSGATEVDCIVIGSGTAGVTTALALGEKGYQVVILEAGPLLLLGHIGNIQFGTGADICAAINQSSVFRIPWASSDGTLPDEGPPNSSWAAVGGRTLFWTGTAPRYKAWDFEDWPIELADLAANYDEAERLIHVGGSAAAERPPYFDGQGQAQAIHQLAEVGLVGRPSPVGVDTRTGRRPGSGFDSSVRRLLSSPVFGRFGSQAPVSLVAQAEATNLRVEAHKVTGVEVLDRRSGAQSLLRARHVVLAGGAVQSARLALRSGLDRLSPDVGRYINDHLFVQAVAEYEEPGRRGTMNIFVDPTPGRPFHFQIQGPFMGTWYHQTHSTMWVECEADGSHVMLASFGVASMDRDNRVELSEQADARSCMQACRVIYNRTPRDRERLAAMEHGLANVAEAIGANMGKTQINPAGGALHEIGGLRMSRMPGEGVTDAYGQFWTVDNLSAADSSPFPSQGSANPYLTITAWSLRHAGRVAEKLASASNS